MIGRYDHGWKRGGFCRRILPPKSLWLVVCSSSSAGIKRKMPQPWFKLGIPVFPSKSSGFSVKFVMSHPVASKCNFEIESKLQKCYTNWNILWARQLFSPYQRQNFSDPWKFWIFVLFLIQLRKWGITFFLFEFKGGFAFFPKNKSTVRRKYLGRFSFT